MTIKKALLRGLLGIPVGVFISTTIGLIISLIHGQLVVIPPIDPAASPLSAYTTQYIVSMVIGFAFAFGSAIFEVDRLSIAKQTAMHLFLMLIVYLPCSILANWVEPDVLSIAIYILVFILIYVAIWFVQYLRWKNKIAKLNKRLQDNR